MNRANRLLAGLVLPAVLSWLAACALREPTPAWQEPPPPPAEGAIVDEAALHRDRLPNGLSVLILEDARLPRAAIGFETRRGAGSVAPELAGVAQIAAEAMQRGAGERDALELARVVEDAGASLSVSAGWDTTGVALSGLSEDLPLFFEILEDVALRPRFDEVEVEKAIAEQRAGIEAAHDDPATLIRWHGMRAIYEGHRFGLPMSGTPETLDALDAAAARAYWEERFVPGNTIFWAVGDLSAERVLEEVRRRFGGLPAGDEPAATPPPPDPTPVARRIVVVDKPDLAQARIVLAHEGIARTDERRIAADIMNDALGGSGFSSRLMQSVRADAGLTYGVGSGFSLRSQPGPYSIATFTRVEEVRRVVDLLLEEMSAIRSERPVDEAELEKFVSYNVGRFGLSLETSQAVLGSLVDLEVHGLPEDSLDTFRSRVRAISLDQVAEVARELLHPDRVAIIVLGPASELVPQLEDLGSLEIRKP